MVKEAALLVEQMDPGHPYKFRIQVLLLDRASLKSSLLGRLLL
jgi:hypothetical protein